MGQQPSDAPRRGPGGTASTVPPDPGLDLADAIGVIGLLGIGLLVGVGVGFVIPGWFRPLVVLPIALVLTIWLGAFVLRGSVARRVTVPALIAMVLATGWIVLNSGHASQHLASNRDPGIYATAGWWLADSPTPEIDIAPGIVDRVDRRMNIRGYSAGPDLDPVIYPQFPDGLPVVLATARELGGIGGLFTAPIVIGGAGIFVLFLLARTMVPGWWALLAPAALSVSLVHIHFSRDTYTEPLQLLLGMGALWAFMRAVEHPRMAIVGGVALGATLLVRLDAVLTLLILPAALLHSLLSGRTDRAFRRSFGGAAAICLLFLGLGWVDLTRYSPSYARSLRDEIVLAGLLLGAAVLVVLAVRPVAGRVGEWMRNHRSALANAMVGLLLALTAFAWVIRPLFTTARGQYVELVAGLLGLAGAEPDPTRSMAEMTGVWLWWYLGAMLVAAVAGGILLARRAMLRPDVRATMLLVMGGALTALYMWDPLVTPDQIWAMRRFLPVVIPTALVLGTYLLADIGSRLARRPRRVWAAVALLVAVSGVITTIPAWATSTYKGSAQMVTEICDALPDDVALFGRPDSPATVWAVALRITCDVPVVVAGQPYARLMMERALGSGHTVVWFGSPCPLGDPGLFTYEASYDRLERTILRPPSVFEDDVVELAFATPPAASCWLG